jgi:hypothetical protein
MPIRSSKVHKIERKTMAGRQAHSNNQEISSSFISYMKNINTPEFPKSETWNHLASYWNKLTEAMYQSYLNNNHFKMK